MNVRNWDIRTRRHGEMARGPSYAAFCHLHSKDSNWRQGGQPRGGWATQLRDDSLGEVWVNIKGKLCGVSRCASLLLAVA